MSGFSVAQQSRGLAKAAAERADAAVRPASSACFAAEPATTLGLCITKTRLMLYEDFEVHIGPRSPKGLLVRVLHSPAGQGEDIVDVPTSSAQPASLANLGVTSGTARNLRPPSTLNDDPGATATVLGARLFKLLFSGQAGRLFYQSLNILSDESCGHGLRLRLRINPRDQTVAQLQHLPWELLFREETEDFLALSRMTPVVRGLDVARPLPPQQLELPLRILITWAQPPAQPQLKLDDELAQLTAILSRNPAIDVQVLESPTSSSLRTALHRFPPHALHFMGHGRFDPTSGEGTLAFHDPETGEAKISGRHLATTLKDFPSLRLVVLNACDSARASDASYHNPFAGTAAALTLGGVPAVVAMQAPIGDAEAIAFSVAFYERLAAGVPVDEAMSEGRQAIHNHRPGSAEWSIPVLFMRSATGELFQPAPARPAIGSTQPVAKTQALRPLILGSMLLLGTIIILSRALDHTEKKSATPSLESQAPTQTLPIKVPEPSPTTLTNPPRKTEPAAPAPRIHQLRLHTGHGELRFEIAGDQRYATDLDHELRQIAEEAAESLSASGSSRGPWIVRLDLMPPSLPLSNQASQSCRLSAAIRLSAAGQTTELGSTSGARTHLDGDVACRAAAGVLAEAIGNKLANYK